MKVCIDAGHGGYDPGAVANGLVEKNLNLQVANLLSNKLKQQGFDIVMIREVDKYVDLDERCNIANKNKCDIVASVHHNAGGGKGYEVIHSVVGGDSKKLAELVAIEFEAIGQKPHGYGIYRKTDANGKDYFCVIRETKMPAIITEFAYLDSDDYKKIDVAKEAQAIANAIIKFAGKKVEKVDKKLEEIIKETATNPDDWMTFFKMLQYLPLLIEKIGNKNK
jgi:N-acetylmuramoyl-L-alanine amidase